MGMFDTRNITRVKVLGVRTAVKSQLFSDVNFGVYSLLIAYDDGKVEVKEVDYNTVRKYAQYIMW